MFYALRGTYNERGTSGSDCHIKGSENEEKQAKPHNGIDRANMTKTIRASEKRRSKHYRNKKSQRLKETKSSLTVSGVSRSIAQ